MTAPTDPGARPRVLHFVTRLGLGGAEAVALSLAQGLRGEFDVAVFAVRGVEDGEIGRAMQAELAAQRIPLYRGLGVPLKLGGMVLVGLRAVQVAREFRPAVMHLHTEIPESTYATMVAVRRGCAPRALVRTIHNSVYWHFWPRLGRWCERHMQPSHVACVSRDSHAAFLEHRAHSGAGPLPAQPVVIYNGVPPAPIAPPAARAPEAPLRVLFAGRFDQEKGTDLLPAILAAVPAPAGGAELVLHGRGKHEALVRRLAAEPPPGWTVRVLPPVAQLRAQLRAFDLVLMPSRYEGLGLVAVEAALAGVPVVATGAPGLREALPADHPWRARPGDAADFAAVLQRALAQRATWPAVAAQARAFAEARFDFATMIAAYARLYRGALARST